MTLVLNARNSVSQKIISINVRKSELSKKITLLELQENTQYIVLKINL